MNTDKARRSLEHYHVQKLLLSQGSLKKENRDALQRHLQECKECQRFAVLVKKFEQRLPETVPSAEFTLAELQEKQDAVRKGLERHQLNTRIFNSIRSVAWAGFTVLLVVLLGWAINNAISRPQSATPGTAAEPTKTGSVIGAYPYPQPDRSPIIPTQITSLGISSTGQVKPTLVPTVSPTELTDTLAGAFSVQELRGENNRKLLKIDGGEYGFRSSNYCEHGPYRWLDSEHLMVFPKVGEELTIFVEELTRPVVLDLRGETWLPPTVERTSGCDLPVWSQALQALISYQDDSLLVNSLNGTVIKSIKSTQEQFNTIRISPSGEKLLVQDSLNDPNGGQIGMFKWIDLESGQEVTFIWAADPSWVYETAWSINEMRVFQLSSCANGETCYAFGDALNRTQSVFNLGGLQPVGSDNLPVAPSGIDSRWVLNDTRSMILHDFWTGSSLKRIVPLFIPEEQKYEDICSLAAIPSDGSCQPTSISPDGNMIWLSGQKSQDSYLVDLRNFIRTDFSGNQFISWSPDSQFTLMGKIDDLSQPVRNYELFSISDQQRQSLPQNSIIEPVWSHQGHLLAFLSTDGRSLVQLDAGNMASKTATLPTIFNQVRWNPSDNQLVLVAQDGSLWLIDAFSDSEPERISPPMEQVRDLRWSPDGKLISYISGSTLFVVK